MKIAISGKGGVGKTTVCALLCREFSRRGYSVLAVDADPDSNLPSALGFPGAEKIKPIVEMKELVSERAGEGGGLVRLNPRVDDIPDTHSATHDGIKLIVMGGVKRAGGGCACPENVFLRELLGHILTESREIVLVDLEAGIEHLGRATAGSVDIFLIVVEPSFLSLQSAEKINRLARELKIESIAVIANKTGSDEERDALEKALEPLKCIGALPFSSVLRKASLKSGIPGEDPGLEGAVSNIVSSLLETE
ncbi:MAG: AAA family ATPase [Candidatus Tritonobacter lacicola]|nr:AAA family ATPase [Candidatus Tritonobacter lacicola]